MSLGIKKANILTIFIKIGKSSKNFTFKWPLATSLLKGRSFHNNKILRLNSSLNDDFKRRIFTKKFISCISWAGRLKYFHLSTFEKTPFHEASLSSVDFRSVSFTKALAPSLLCLFYCCRPRARNNNPPTCVFHSNLECNSLSSAGFLTDRKEGKIVFSKSGTEGGEYSVSLGTFFDEEHF